MTIQNNIKTTFQTLLAGMDPEKTINIIETFNEGKWATVYICASRFQEELTPGEGMPLSPMYEVQ